jgi:hypothetical protein
VPVTIGRDYGSETEIVTGLKAGDMIVTDVTDDVVEGAAGGDAHGEGSGGAGCSAEAECAAGWKHAVWQREYYGSEFAGTAGRSRIRSGKGKQQGPSQAEE